VRLTARPLTAAAFAPFGDVVTAAAVDGRVALPGIATLRPAAPPLLGWFHAAASRLPLTVTAMERHRLSSQCFVPEAGASWLLLVAPHDAAGGPDMAAARAFVADDAQAATYAPDVWHHPLVALGRAARFTVLTFLDGSAEDEEFTTLPEPVEVLPVAPQQQSRRPGVSRCKRGTPPCNSA